MATQQSTSTEIPSENPHTAGPPAVLPFLSLATELLQQCQGKTAEEGPVSLQFNHGQCRYLVKKLEMAVQSARESMSLSSPRESSKEDWKLVGKWKFLVRLAMDVDRFIEECCKEEHWLQAASMLINAFEHVVSLDSHLELCIWGFTYSGTVILETHLRRELISISDAHDRRTGDLVNMLKKAGVTLKMENFGDSQGNKLAASLLEELEATLAINPVTLGQPISLAGLNVHDNVVLLKRVAASSFSDPGIEEIATSLAPRFLVSVADPFAENTDIGFMKVDCASLRREIPLGKGGFGEVYRVQWLGIPAAEKVLIGADKDSETLLPDFVKEVSMLARQSHPNIVRLLCFVKDVPKVNQFECSMVQELMQKDLAKLIEERMKSSSEAPESPRRFPFSIDEVVDILLQIAEGMDYLHRRKVWHRDLKAPNILVKCEMCTDLKFECILAKVADFGISKTKEKTITFSHPTWNKGTTRWMAPELIKFNDKTGDWNPDWNPFKCDVYSFGMLSYEVLTGSQPFTNLYPNAIKLKVLGGVRPPLPSEYPTCLRSMIRKCWRGEPSERPTFAEICRELRFMKGALLIGWDL